MSRKPSPRIETQLVHAGEHKPRFAGAAVLPIFQSSVFEFPDARMEKSNYHDLLYPRLNNLPNHKVLGDKLAALEACEEAFVSASGMAAISAALLTVPGEGGHVLVQPGVYGGTHNLLSDDFGDLGLSFDLLEGEDPAQWARQLRPQTRAIYVEALTNPRLQILDHAAVVQFAKAHGLVSIIDNTFATPVNFQPRLLGYDLVLHSATKYLNGHSDLTAGVVAGSREWVEKVRKRLNHFGGNLDAHACFLLHRGLKTLALRVRHQNETAQRLAEYLESHARVRQVSYPGLAIRSMRAGKPGLEVLVGCFPSSSKAVSRQPAG